MNKQISSIYFLTLIIILSASILTGCNTTTQTLNIQPCMNDFSGYITNDYESLIKGLCDEIYDTTGVETAIVITNFSEDIDTYALKLFENNNIGSKDKDTGMLIVINSEDNDWIILVGYGLEGVLNDAKNANIGRTYLEPYIDNYSYGEGIYYTLGILGTTIYDSGEFHKEKNLNTFWKDNKNIILAILILLIIIIITKGKIFFLPNIGPGFGGGRTGGGRGKR